MGSGRRLALWSGQKMATPTHDHRAVPPRLGLTDLHRHLDGSLRRSTVQELAAKHGLEIPNPLGFHAGMGLQQALACFDFTLALLQQPDSVARIAKEICEDAAGEGVSRLEIRFAPQLHRGAAMEEIVDAALDGIDRRAGLLLCGLYGQPPALFDQLVDIASSRAGVVGLDLAGGPDSADDFSMAHYAGAFTKARELGLGRTVHAGEGRPASEIRQAIELLHATRIGHGTSLLEDPALVDRVLELGIVIEACPTSNVHTGAIAEFSDHPLPHWLDAGIRATVNTDNTLFSGVDAPSEYRSALAIPGMDRDKLAACIVNGHAAAFARGA